MSEIQLLEHRLKKVEEDIKILYGKVNTSAVAQAQANTKLDNLLVTMGELKESIADIKNRPSNMWEKVSSAFVGAIAAAIAAAIMAMILK